MRKLVERALGRLPRLADDHIRSLLAQLSDENSALEAALDSMAEGMIVLDERHVPTLFNRAAERLVPYRASASQTDPVWKHLADDALAEYLRRSLEREDSEPGRDFIVEHQRERKVIRLSTSTLVRERKIAGTLVLLEDITERKRDEMRLRRAENLAALTTLAAGVAHEIKNPLGSLSIRVQLLRKSLASGIVPPREQIEAHLGVIDEEMDRLNRIVVDFLFAARPVNVQPVDCDPNAVAREVAELMRPETERDGVILELDLCPSVPVIPLDSRYMKQAILNLVKNSLQATPRGGSIAIRSACKDGEFSLSVEDSGRGIDPDNLGKIFEPYFTTKENGTGLGLTLAYKIVKEHGGDVSVSSEPGRGTTVTISVPVPQRERRLITQDAGTPEKR